MSLVDPLYAQWLQNEADYTVLTDDAVVQRWGATAGTSQRVTPIAGKDDAVAQAAAELDFLGRGPFAIDVHTLVGTDWQQELGRVVTLSIDQLGYDSGIDVFVIEVNFDRATGMSTVTVIRPLRGLS